MRGDATNFRALPSSQRRGIQSTSNLVNMKEGARPPSRCYHDLVSVVRRSCSWRIRRVAREDVGSNGTPGESPTAFSANRVRAIAFPHPRTSQQQQQQQSRRIISCRNAIPAGVRAL